MSQVQRKRFPSVAELEDVIDEAKATGSPISTITLDGIVTTKDGQVFDRYELGMHYKGVDPDGEVYFVEAGPFVKIGYSRKSTKRFTELQTSCPYEIKLLGFVRGSIGYERRLHRIFAKHHARGEWFHLSDDLRKSIQEIVAEAVS